MGFVNLIKLLWSDWLLPMLESMPAILWNAGDGIQTAGEEAIKVSHIINGEGNAYPNITEIIDTLTNIINDCNGIIMNASTLIENAGNAIGNVNVQVPTLTPQFTNILNIKVVTGVKLEFSEIKPFGDVASELQRGVNELNNISGKLQDTTLSLSNLKNALEDTGNNLATLGAKLKDSGIALKQLAGNQQNLR